MSFNILNQLQNCTGSYYGDNLNIVPSRIIPICLPEYKNDTTNSKSYNVIYYIPPNLKTEYIVCNTEKKIPEPSAYFRSPNTFMKSLLYLSNKPKNILLRLGLFSNMVYPFSYLSCGYHNNCKYNFSWFFCFFKSLLH